MKKAFLALAALSITATTASAALSVYTASLSELNESRVTGNVILTHDSDAQTLTVNVAVENLEPNEDHVGHIHGVFGPGNAPADSVSPTMADDDDGDGYVEVLEALDKYGDILLPLETINTPTGAANTTHVYDLTDDSQFFSPVSMTQYSADDIFPLNFREIVFHGKTVATGEGMGTAGEVDGSGGYKGVLPVTVGEIVGMPAVPEPASLSLVALAGLALRRRR